MRKCRDSDLNLYQPHPTLRLPDFLLSRLPLLTNTINDRQRHWTFQTLERWGVESPLRLLQAPPPLGLWPTYSRLMTSYHSRSQITHYRTNRQTNKDLDGLRTGAASTIELPPRFNPAARPLSRVPLLPSWMIGEGNTVQSAPRSYNRTR